MEAKKSYKTAVGYLRVSTAGQEKGTSLESQEESIKGFCQGRDILLVKTFVDKCSGKDFNRPQFEKAMQYLKENKGEIDLFLTKRIDRFTRDTKEGLTTIEKINSLGTEVNYVDDWLDDIGSSQGKMVQTIKMAVSSYERNVINERCRLGERSALKGGRYIKTPPLGYSMGKLSNGKACIMPNEKAPLVRALFEDFVTGQYSQVELIKKYKHKGLNTSKSALSRLLENVLYMGYIDLKAHKIEPYTQIKGLHTPIITEEIFYKAQDVKKGKNRMVKKVRPKNENFPLSGFMLCPVCGNPVYGSTSNNGSKKKIRRYYNNYKCSCDCVGQSYKADIVHEEFYQCLASIKPSQDIMALFELILIDTYKESIKDIEMLSNRINKQIIELESNQLSLTEKYITGKIDEVIYQKLLEKYKMDLLELKAERANYNSNNRELDKYLSFGMGLLSNLDVCYKKSSIEVKVKLLGSYFTEKLVFENGKFRTLPFNDVIMLISKYTNELQIEKKKVGGFFSKTSHSVLGAGLEPAQPLWSQDFKSCVSTIPPSERP